MDKRLLITLLLGILIGGSLQISPASAATAWVYESSSTTNDLQAVRALSSDVAIAVGANGIIKKTTNKGYTWLTKTSGTTNKLEDIAITGSVGWAVGAQGTILKTGNAGESWSPQTSGTTQTLYAVDKVSDSIAFIVGSSDTFLKTTNGGLSWEKQLTFGIAGPLASPDFYGVDFITSQPNIGWAVGSKYTLFGTTHASIFKTTDGGNTWTKQSSPVVKNLRAIDMFSTLVGWIVGDDGTILKTTDGGTTWVQQGAGVTTANLYSVHAVNDNEVWAVGAGGVILHTTNGGSSWSIVSSGTADNLFDVHFASSTAGWAVGASGTIRHYSDFDFVIDALPPSRTIAAGSSTTYLVGAILIGGVSQSVSLGVSGLPAGASFSFSYGAGNPSFLSLLTITTSPTTPTGSHTLTISGSGGGLTRSIAVTLVITSGPDFGIAVAAPLIEIAAGSSKNLTLTITSAAGFSAPVALSVSGEPPGVSHSFSPPSVTPPAGGSANSNMTINVAASAAPGTYTLTITGTSGALSHSVTVDLTITAPPPAFDFEIAATSPSSVSIILGQTANFDLSINLLSGSPQPVALSASGVPPGATASFTAPSGSPPFVTTFSITTTASTIPGTYGIVITGTGGGISRTLSLTLILATSTATTTTGPTPDFALAAYPSAISVAKGASATSTITITSLGGFSAPVALSYSWVGAAPLGVTVNLPSPVTPPSGGSGTSTLQVSTSGTSPTGTFTLRVNGASGSLSHQVDLAITITVAGPSTPGCLIATATFGSELTPEVAFLRAFRDRDVLSTFAGREFMGVFNAWYYSFSPSVAALLYGNEALRQGVKLLLYPLIGILMASREVYSAASWSPELGVALAGLVASAMIGAVYASPLAMLASRRRWPHRAFAKLAAALLAAAILALMIGEALGSGPLVAMGSSVMVLSGLFAGFLLAHSALLALRSRKWRASDPQAPATDA
ncbi:MAG: YCF48-related protein [Candidatus Bathyarchaeia archaeon]